MRKILLGLTCTLLLGVVLAVLSGALSLVETYGNSMAPRIAADDLVVVRASDDYRVGDVIAYRSRDLGQVVLHRVTAIEDGRYTLRGDHNTFDDPEQPTRHELMGKELLHLPGGGAWADRLTSPIVLGVLTFTVLAAGSTSAHTRLRRRRKTRTTAMAQHATSTRNGWPPRLRTTVAIAAATTCVGLTLGAFSWTRADTTAGGPAHEMGPSMRFDYQAEVPRSPAYDGTEVTAPDPVFRKLTDQLIVRYDYRGEPGTVSVAAELSTASGWRSTVPIGSPVTFEDNDHSGTVRLDLDRLQGRAEAAAEVIGIPATDVNVTVVPAITTRSGDTFAPELPLTLNPLQLSLVGGRAALTVSEAAPVGGTGTDGDAITVAGRQLPITTLRTIAVGLVSGPLLLLFLVGLASSRNRSAGEAATIKRRYGALLLPVAPMTTPAGRPVVEVTDFPTLARLAERYSLLVMHWTRSDVETFIVHDDGVTYRYRTGSGTATTTSSTHTQKSLRGR